MNDRKAKIAQAIEMHPDAYACGIVFMRTLLEEGFEADDIHAVLNQVTAYATNPRDPVFNGMRRAVRENGVMLTGTYRPTHAQILAAGIGAMDQKHGQYRAPLRTTH